MRGWRAWYEDGRTYASNRLAWQEIPASGIVGVVVYLDPPYRTILTAGDWYYMQDGEIHRVKNHPEWGQWAEPPDVECESCVKRSGAMEDEAFEAMLADMMEARACP